MLVDYAVIKLAAYEAYASELKATLAVVRHDMDELQLKVEGCPVLNLLGTIMCLTVEPVKDEGTREYTCSVVDGILTG